MYGSGRDVAERIRSKGSTLTTAERRVAAAILEAPQAVGFGTVADLARAASVGAASVVRLATKLGFEGYSDLQESIQRDLTRQLRPAAERIREDVDERRTEHLTAELGNVRTSIEAADDDDLRTVVGRLADRDRPVVVLSGDASSGDARQFVGQLQLDGVDVDGDARLYYNLRDTGDFLRATVSQTWVVDMGTAASHTLKLRGYDSGAGTVQVRALVDTNIAIVHAYG